MSSRLFEARFWAKVQKTDSCWLWTAAKNRFGYGRFMLNGKVVRAHRVAWTLAYGQIPEGAGFHGTCVLHLCDNPMCVNPSHLVLGTQGENCRDMASKGRAWNPTADACRATTQCPAGHDYSPENTYRGSSGRKCKICVRARATAYYHRAVKPCRKQRNS